MEYADKKLKCEKCGEEFIFLCGEQMFFEEKGFIPPKKCPKCRGKEDVQRPKEHTYPVNCPSCKKNFNITFDSKGQEVLCYDCFLAQENKKDEKIASINSD